nr:hypothetical protein Iba_chr02fCG11860 [Ipomoea batatas]
MTQSTPGLQGEIRSSRTSKAKSRRPGKHRYQGTDKGSTPLVLILGMVARGKETNPKKDTSRPDLYGKGPSSSSRQWPSVRVALQRFGRHCVHAMELKKVASPNVANLHIHQEASDMALSLSSCSSINSGLELVLQFCEGSIAEPQLYYYYKDAKSCKALLLEENCKCQSIVEGLVVQFGATKMELIQCR